MEIKAESKYIKVSPRKLQLVAKEIKKSPLSEALEVLPFFKKKAARPLLKTLNSAVANAVNNLKLKKENLKIKSIEILKAPMLKRWRPVSRGRSHSYVKRMSNIKVILEETKKSKRKV